MRQPHKEPLFSSQFLEKNVTGGHAEKNALDAVIDAAGAPYSLYSKYEANAANPLIKSPPAGDTRQRPFVTARAAAELLGVPETVVIDDVQEGMDGALPALIGGRYGEAWVVHAFELEGDRLERHAARLRATVRGSVAP